MRRFRSTKQQVEVFDTQRALRRFVLRRVSLEYAANLLFLGKAIEVKDEEDEVIGIELVDPQPTPQTLTFERFNPMFSQPEVHAIAGAHFKFGRSRTASLTEAQRAERKDAKTGRSLAPEDLIERSTEKIKCFARPLNEARPDRSTTVYPSGVVTGQYAKKGS